MIDANAAKAPGRLWYWVADWNLSRAEAAGRLAGTADAAKSHVADMVDCTGSALNLVRPALASVKRIAGYITGGVGIEWTAAQFDEIPAGVAVLHIDQTDRFLPLLATKVVTKDVEPGASTPAEAATVALARIPAGDDYMIYVDASELVAVEEEVARRGLPHGVIVAYQYASPTSNPQARIPGTDLMLGVVNADLSVIVASVLPLPETPPEPAPSTGTGIAELVQYGDRGWRVSPAPTSDAAPFKPGGPDEWQMVLVGFNRSTGKWHAVAQPARKTFDG